MSHSQILQDGVQRWNDWRVGHPDVLPDLAGADLHGRLLRGVNLRSANLSGANLRDVNFRKADLSGANLEQAILNRAFFSAANLRDARFKRARLYETVFANTDLTHAIGLDDCDHRGPSVVDHRTLARTRLLPLEFLRGCGLPEEAIRVASHVGSPTFYSCFISYSTVDRPFVEKLFGDLQNGGVRCWYAPEDIKIGEKIRPAIESGIRAREKLLLVLSAASIASTWVETEVESALERERELGELVLFPVRIDDTAMSVERGWAADIRRARHIGDFCRWSDAASYSRSLQRLLRDLTVERSNNGA